jgi:hypothetical protein
MTASPTLSRAPDFARRLGVILAGLAALIARRFVRDPFHAALIVPLWRHITRAARRLDRAFARLAAAPAPAPSPRRPHPAGPHRRSVLPTRRGWLVATLGSEAAAYASQLKFLLAEPEAADALANSLAARRTLAPIRRMLGLTPPRPRRPRVRVRKQPPPPAAPRPTPPAWLLERQPGTKARPYWMPPRRRRSG